MTTPPLSPAAQAVLDTAHRQPFMDADGRPNFAGAVAAALRAVADQVGPTQADRDAVPEFHAQVCMNGMAFVVNELRCIAAELGGEGEG